MLYFPASSLNGLLPEPPLSEPVALPSHGTPIAYLIEHYHSCFSVALAAHNCQLTPNIFLTYIHDGESLTFSTIFVIFLILILLITVMSSFN